MKIRTLLITVLLILAGAGAWYWVELRPPNRTDDVRTIVEIPSGSSVASIADILAGKGIIRSPFAFSLYTRLHGLQSKLKAGSFVLRPSMSAKEVVSVLTEGHSTEATVTIPEGYTVEDIDALLAGQGIMEKGELTKCAQTCDFSSFAFLSKTSAKLAPRGGRLEGYLFPDTYFVLKEEFVPKFFLERLLGMFRTRVADEYAADIKASGHSLQEIVTMASLVEEETRGSDERPVVAGILWKRLKAGMSLGVDASVRYGLDKPKGKPLTATDLDNDSPYNLRKVRGLPPGPIANPSLSSIQAALHPKDSPYWYYLHDHEGQIHYAVTNDEHNANRARFLQ
jgi:UPF0755 protein